MFKRTIHLLLTLAVLTTILHADDSVAPFLGKWKLDPAHSRLTDQMKVGLAGPNKYNLIFSGDNVETVTADGTDQPGLFGALLPSALRTQITGRSSARPMAAPRSSASGSFPPMAKH